MITPKAIIKKLLIRAGLQKDYFLAKEASDSRFFSESKLIELFYKFYLPGSCKVMIDVGAHLGESFAFYERLGWRIYAFEPDADNRAKIKVNSPQTKLYTEAVSNVSGKEVSFYSSQESSGISGLIPFHSTHELKSNVITITLDKFCSDQGIKKVNFLKIDTEGNDLFVLQGFPFDLIQPDIILCEFEDAKTNKVGYDYKLMGNFLREKGYEVYLSEWNPVVRYGTKHQWRRITTFGGHTQLINEKGWGNFIAVHPERQVSFRKALNAYLKGIGETGIFSR